MKKENCLQLLADLFNSLRDIVELLNDVGWPSKPDFVGESLDDEGDVVRCRIAMRAVRGGKEVAARDKPIGSECDDPLKRSCLICTMIFTAFVVQSATLH